MKNPEPIKFSILLTSIAERSGSYLPKLVAELHRQIGDRKDVELIVFLDNRARTVGLKRQNLLGLAQGQYIAYFDDDDWPAKDYVSSIVSAIEDNTGADVIVFDVKYTDIISGESFICKYDKSFSDRGKGKDGVWRGPPAHTHAIRKLVAQSVQWPERPPKGKSWTLDVMWCDQIAKRLKTQARIDGVLYYYNFDKHISETLKRNRGRDGR